MVYNSKEKLAFSFMLLVTVSAYCVSLKLCVTNFLDRFALLNVERYLLSYEIF
jgi:hypothetical protein